MTGATVETSAPTRLLDSQTLVGSLPALRDRLVRDGATPTAAATYLAGWFGGGAAGEVARSLLETGACPLAGRDTIRWRVTDDGLPESVVLLGVPLVVAAADAAGALIDAVRPVIDGCHRLGHVGRPGLWNEVADGFAYALTDLPDRADHRAAIATVRRLTALPGAPWRARPVVQLTPTSAGPISVVQKGGCCLAFTGSYEVDPAALDEVDRAYGERFRDAPGAPDYCTTCPRRSFADCEARQVWWHERQRERTDTTPAVEPTR